MSIFNRPPDKLLVQSVDKKIIAVFFSEKVCSIEEYCSNFYEIIRKGLWFGAKYQPIICKLRYSPYLELRFDKGH